MKKEKYIEVDTVEGLYDVKKEYVTQNINDRTICFFGIHHWIDAHLDWRKGEIGEDGGYMISIVGDDYDYKKSTQRKQDLIRFCTTCKKIDCIHIIREEDEIEYRVNQDKFCHISHTIGKCKICKRRIYLSGCTVHKPNANSFEFANKIAKEFGYPKNWRNTWGSAIHCEFASTLSALLEKSEVEARDYVVDVFTNERVRE